MSVSTRPGATTLTVTPRDATSRASALARPDEARLGRGVVGLPGEPDERPHRAHEDDPTGVRADHLAKGSSRAEERPAQVDVEHALPGLVGHPQRQLVDRDAGVRDEHVDVAELGLDLGERRVHGRAVGDVARDARAPRPTPSVPRRGERRDRVAVRGEPAGDRDARCLGSHR